MAFSLIVRSRLEGASSHFQTRKGPSRGLLRSVIVNSREPLFEALMVTRDLPGVVQLAGLVAAPGDLPDGDGLPGAGAGPLLLAPEHLLEGDLAPAEVVRVPHPRVPRPGGQLEQAVDITAQVLHVLLQVGVVLLHHGHVLPQPRVDCLQ